MRTQLKETPATNEFEEPLENEEENYTLFNLIEEGVQICELVFDDAGNLFDIIFLDVNPAYEKHFGVRREQIVGKHIKEVLPIIEQKWLKHCWEVVYRCVGIRFEEYHSYLNKWFEVFSYPIGDNRFFAVFSDITERKAIEMELRDSRSKYRTLIETTSDFIWEIDSQGRYTYCSPQIEKLWGLKPEEMIGKSPFDLIPSEYKNVAIESFSEFLLSPRKVNGLEFASYDGYGNIVFIEINAVPFFDNDNKLLGFRGISRDITERKKAEEEIKTAHDNLEEKVKERTLELEKAYISLKESEQSLAEAQKIAKIGNWEWNIVTNEIYFSDELYRIFALKPRKPAISFNDALNYIHCDDRNYITYAVNDAINGNLHEKIEFRIILDDGTEHIVLAKTGFYFDENNVIIGMRGTIQDITDVKLAEEEKAKIDIARKKEIHHRIKNNLQVVSSLLDLESERFKGKKTIEESQVLEAFKESIDRVISMALIHEELHRSGNTDLINFSHYIEELADNLLLTYRLGNAGTSMYKEIEENIFFDMDIAVPLGIIINELVSNSLKYAFVETDKGEIKIELHREKMEKCENIFILSVLDNGVGIPEDLNIYDLNSLGLQLVTTLVDQLNGELELKRDNGTKFTIKFAVIEK